MGKTHYLKIAGVHGQDGAGVFGNRVLVVSDIGLVGRPHLNKGRATLPQHIGDTKSSPDLHRLSPRHDHFLAARNGGQAQENRRRVVVDDQRTLRARKLAEQLGHPTLTRASTSCFQIELQIAVALGSGAHRFHGIFAQRSPPQVRVQYHSGRIDDRHRHRSPQRHCPPLDRIGKQLCAWR